MHVDAIKTNQRVLLFDDILATGGTCNAAINLINNFTPEAITVLVFMELKALNGRAQLQGIEKFTSLALI
jgi:adenine phosphoribosyltransferase